MQTRFRLFSFAFLFAFLLLIGRLFFWQIIKGEDLSKQARGQYLSGKIVTAPRGNILANDSTWLAVQGESWLVYASPLEINQDISVIADKLAPLFVNNDIGKYDKNETLNEASRLKTLLSKEDLVWIPLKNKVSPETKSSIAALGINGIGFEFQETRVYPESSSAAHLLGFVGKDSEGKDQGYFGLEGEYDTILSGKSGYISRESDAKGVPISIGDSRQIYAIGGADLVTHIDKAIQLMLDEKLEKAMETYGASAVTAIVMDVKSGGILAMSSYPSYDQRKYFQYGNEFFINPSVSASFEPGSIFKVLVMASALDAKAVEPDTKCDVCSGPIKVDKYYIETWNQKYYPDSEMVDVIVHSDNVGMVFVGNKLGKDNMYDYLEKFGIGQLTGIDLQGEMTPKLRERGTWSIVDLATASFGQGIATTPIQMINAVNVIANDGVIVAPSVVKRIVGAGWAEEVNSQSGQRVISERAANQITAMMVEAAKEGEAKWTHLRGFKVAGKTGTAQIPIAGHYDDEKTIASFVGFAPYDDPEFIMLVTLKEPQTSPWASETAAPLWYSIAKDLFLYLGIHPEN